MLLLKSNQPWTLSAIWPSSRSKREGESVVTISEIQDDYAEILVDSFANYALEASIVATRKEVGGELL